MFTIIIISQEFLDSTIPKQHLENKSQKLNFRCAAQCSAFFGQRPGRPREDSWLFGWQGGTAEELLAAERCARYVMSSVRIVALTLSSNETMQVQLDE